MCCTHILPIIVYPCKVPIISILFILHLQLLLDLLVAETSKE